MNMKKVLRYLDKIYNLINKNSTLFIIIGFLFVNILFNYRVFWHELIFDKSKVGAIYGEVEATEYAMETIYRKLINFENPFTPFTTVLYPFEVDVVGSDPGFAFNLFFFRPFFSLHQSVAMVIVSGFLFGNIGMYLLLRRLKITKAISFIMALAFGYSTILTERLGHLNYLVVYLFPWFYFFLSIFFTTKKPYIKIISAIASVFFLILALWQNMYYFIMILISCGSLTLYYLWKLKFKVIDIVRKNILYMVPAVITGILLMYPWLRVLYETFIFSETPAPNGWGGAIEFSADVFGIFIPSDYNYYYGQFIPFFTRRIEFAQNIFENFTYPGVIILIGFFSVFLFFKRFSSKLKLQIIPYLLISVIFYILTLGPFLHIAGRWALTLEGIKVVVPLPFVLLHYIPFIGNIRSPGRFSVAMVFFAYIVVAYVLTGFLQSKSKKFKLVFLSVLFIIFIIDHRFPDTDVAPPHYIPQKIFTYIGNDPGQVSVLRIPFTVRDGFTYFGDYNSILVNEGQLIFKKPAIGGYSGRISNYIKIYYQHDPLLGYLGRLIDDSLATNPGIDNSVNINWDTINLDESKKTLDLLSIKYVIVENKFQRSKLVLPILSKLGFKEIIKDETVSLLVREPVNREFLNMDIKNTDHRRLLGLGWYDPEDNFRWTTKESSVLFKINKPQDLILQFTAASFYKNQPVTVYVNKKNAGTVNLTTEMSKHILHIDKKYIKDNINQIYFVFKNGYRPSEVANTNDQRSLAGKFESVRLIKKK